MSFQHQGFEAVTGIEPERALNIGMGAAQAPLWAAFYASAGLGAAWWWSTAWTRTFPTFDFAQLSAPEPHPAAKASVEALDEAALDPIEAEVEEVVELAEAAEVEAAVEAEIAPAAATAVESVSDAVETEEAAIGETADVAPEAPTALEVVAEPVVLEAADVAPEAEATKPVAVVAEKPPFKPSKKKSPQAE